MTPSPHRRAVAPLVTVVVAVLCLVASATPASAATLPLDWDVSVSTHLATMNTDVTVDGAHFTGSVNTDTGALSGSISVPSTVVHYAVWGIPVADITMAMAPVGKITGKVDLKTMRVTAKSTFFIKLTDVRTPLLPWWNLVGNSCATSTSTSATMSGTASLTEPSTVTGTYTIPPFANCGMMTWILNWVAPGPGNTLAVTFTP